MNRYGYREFSEFNLYLLSIYFVLMTISTVGYGDITGSTIYE
ncbi:MAG: ion channel [bacterium]